LFIRIQLYNHNKEPFMKPILSVFLFVFALSALILLPLQANSASHEGHSGMTMPESTPMTGHGMAEGAAMLGEVTEDGVKAMAHLNDVAAIMSQAGRKENYHFMVMFTEAAGGAAITEGSVALRITSPGEEKAGETIALPGMDGHFGADINLPVAGEYRFEVGTKLADGSKRQFQFQYMVK
jgi:hypothetical protein